MKSRIRKKVTTLVMTVAILSLSIISLLFFASIALIRSDTVETSELLGTQAGVDAKASLEFQAKQRMVDVATEKSNYIELKFNIIENYVEDISKNMTRIYENADDYSPNIVFEPTIEMEGLNTQLMYSSTIENKQTGKEEIGLVSNIKDMLYHTVENDDVVAAAYIATESGIVIMSDYTPYKKFDEGSNSPNPYEAYGRPWYVKAKAEQAFIFTDLMYDIHGGGLAIVAAQPFYKNGEFMGVAGVGSFLTDIVSIVNETKLLDSGYSFIVDDKGVVNVSSKENSEISSDFDLQLDLRNSENNELARVVTDMVGQKSGLAEINIDGEKVYLAYEPLKSLGWSFATVVPVNEMMSAANESQQKIQSITNQAISDIDANIRIISLTLIGLVFFILLVLIFVSMHWSKRFSDPIVSLTNQVHNIEGNNLDTKVSIDTDDEVKDLSHSFNAMIQKLKTYIDDVTQMTAEKERIVTELNVATQIQISMMPSNFLNQANEKDYDIYASMTTAKEVGGDFYDFFEIDDNHLCVVIADVSGKGVPAALFMVKAKILIKNSILSGKSPAETFMYVNNQLCENNDASMFVTAFMGVLTLNTGKFTYVNAGHNYPLIKDGTGKFSWLKSKSGFVLAGMEDMPYRQMDVTFENGDVLFLYTDGVTEALNPNLELYSDPRLEQTLNNITDETMDAKDITENVLGDVKAFAEDAEQADDITILTVKYKGNHKAMSWETTVKADLDCLGEVTEKIDNLLEELNFSIKHKTQVQLAVEEIFVNIANYAYDDSTGEVTIKCEANGNPVALSISFIDSGEPYNPLEHEDPDTKQSAEERDIGGLGILLVKKSMDEVDYQYEDNKNIFTIRKVNQ